jgi:PAS domain-containing protein
LDSYPGKVFYNEQGEGQQLLGTIIDITDQKNAEESMMNINQRLEIALEAGKLGSYELDIKTGEIECTDQCKAVYGLSVEDPFNYSLLIDSIVPSFREKVQQEIQAALNTTIFIARNTRCCGQMDQCIGSKPREK